ncbi:MAG: SRPBCC family protein [Acidimicrobiia bacterium]
MPGKTFQQSAIAEAPIARVWIALNDPKSWESVPGVDRIVESVIDPEGQLQEFSFESEAAGKKYLGHATPAGREPEKMMAWDIETSEVRGRIVVSLSGADGETRVAVTLRLESVGVLSSVFFPVIASTIGDGFPKTVHDFAEGLSQP